MLRVNTSIVTAFVSLHFHALPSSLHSPFIHPSFSSRSLTLTVSFTYIVSCIQRYCHIRSPPSALHTSTLLFPLIIMSSVHFYCHLHSHWICPCEACTGMVKARTGTGLLILCLYRPCVGMARVSLHSGFALFVCFVFCLFVNEGLNGKPLLLSWRHIEHFVVCVYFQTHCYQTASEFGDTSHFFSKDTAYQNVKFDLNQQL